MSLPAEDRCKISWRSMTIIRGAVTPEAAAAAAAGGGAPAGAAAGATGAGAPATPAPVGPVGATGTKRPNGDWAGAGAGAGAGAEKDWLVTPPRSSTTDSTAAVCHARR